MNRNPMNIKNAVRLNALRRIRPSTRKNRELTIKALRLENAAREISEEFKRHGTSALVAEHKRLLAEAQRLRRQKVPA